MSRGKTCLMTAILTQAVDDTRTDEEKIQDMIALAAADAKLSMVSS